MWNPSPLRGWDGGCELSREEHALVRKDLASPPTVGREGDPEDLGFSIGRQSGDEGVFVQKANRPPNRRSEG